VSFGPIRKRSINVRADINLLPLEHVLLHVSLQHIAPLPVLVLDLPGEEPSQELADALQHVHVLVGDVIHDGQARAVDLLLVRARRAAFQDVVPADKNRLMLPTVSQTNVSDFVCSYADLRLPRSLLHI
jgi:hypothetical protein